MTRLDVDRYVNGIRSGDRAILSRAITVAESQRQEDRSIASSIIRALGPATGGAKRIGISGVPGAGKSTFIDLWTSRWLGRGESIAVLAVDPSSTVSGGSILGDKTRMVHLVNDPNVFIRPSPSGTNLGGVARATREAMLLCEAAGFSIILVETVGVGQSEVAVADLVDFFMVLVLAGAGDELQGIKRGIFELADLVVVHKADGEHRQRAMVAASELASALKYIPAHRQHWMAEVLPASSITGEGLGDIVSVIDRFWEQEALAIETRRKEQQVAAMWRWAAQSLSDRFRADVRVAARAKQLEAQLQEAEIDPYDAASELVALFTSGAVTSK